MAEILAVSTVKCSPYLPAIAWLKTARIDAEGAAGMAAIAPPRTSDAVIAKIPREVVETIGTAAIRTKLAAQPMEAIGDTPVEFGARINGEIAR